MAEYVIMVDGKLETYNNYDDIPTKFDHVISFEPDAPESPHSEEDHEEMETYNTKLQELMRRENASSN